MFGRSHAPLRAINRKPILPTEEEIASNTRARSAKLRIAEKVSLAEIGEGKELSSKALSEIRKGNREALAEDEKEGEL